MDDFGEFFGADLLELLAAFFELFEGFHECLGHPVVCLGRAADDGEFLARGDAFVAVFVVETDAEQSGTWAKGRALVGLRDHEAYGGGRWRGFKAAEWLFLREEDCFARASDFTG